MIFKILLYFCALHDIINLRRIGRVKYTGETGNSAEGERGINSQAKGLYMDETLESNLLHRRRKIFQVKKTERMSFFMRSFLCNKLNEK